ncbi:MAG TPA: DEAD/DEAH box helicase [Caulobacteraceae bacterium]|nr:DEAD/DEAH box helicase [Caulobacteraceae bacterium]
MTQFTDLGLATPLLRALQAEGYTQPTPIQAQAIPYLMQGRDLLGIAQTGTGKTAAFALPILHRLAANPKKAARRTCRALVLSPTRELASQIADSFRSYGRHLNMKVAVIFGGVKYGAQIKALEAGIDVLVATPGRLIDHLQQNTCQLHETEIFVLDEADQMLDLGFLVPIRKIVGKLPAARQNLFFSATMPSEIGKLAGELLKDPAKVSITPAATTVDKVEQTLLYVEALRKRALLAELFAEKALSRVIVFTRTKRGADKVARYLEACGVGAAAIHGDKSQGQRERALAAFKAGACRALVATDIAARGIDVDGVTHVINYELPNVPEAYVHRIGRTARAGATGVAISLCSDDERALLKDIQKATRQTIPSFDRRNDKVLAQATAVAEALAPPAEKSRGHDDGEQRANRDGAGRQANRKRRPQHRPGGHSAPKSGGEGRGAGGGSRNPGRGRGEGGGKVITSGSWSPLDAK